MPEQATVVLHPPCLGGFCPETGTMPAKIIKPTVKKVSFANIVNFFISSSPLNLESTHFMSPYYFGLSFEL
jgi:hypothetical protein